MDNRITGKRLANVLSYDWFKILIIVVAAVFLWSLAFTMGAPRASVGQTFGLFVYSDFQCAKSESEVLSDARDKGTFSYDVLDFNTRSLTEQYYGTIMAAATSVQEGDVIVLSDFTDGDKKNSSVFRAFVDSYGLAYDIDELISDAEKYCLDYRAVAMTDGKYTVDSAAVKQIFADRMKKDPRFRDKNSQKYADGVLQEVARIKKVWNDAQKLKQVLEAHPELKANYRRFEQTLANMDENNSDRADYLEYYENHAERAYGINLGKLTGGKTPITDLYARVLSGEGDEKIITAEGIILCVFDYESYQPHLQYETVAFINYIIESYSDFFDRDFVNLID